MITRIPLTSLSRDWPLLTLSQRLEASVAFLLTLVIDLVILVALTASS